MICFYYNIAFVFFVVLDLLHIILNRIIYCEWEFCIFEHSISNLSEKKHFNLKCNLHRENFVGYFLMKSSLCRRWSFCFFASYLHQSINNMPFITKYLQINVFYSFHLQFTLNTKTFQSSRFVFIHQLH